jgi:hypothetical protein
MCPWGSSARPAGRGSSSGAKGRTPRTCKRGGFDLGPRLADLDLDGVFGEVLYPSLALGMYQLTDPAFQWACLDAYNR